MQTDVMKGIEKFNQGAIDSAKRLGDIQMRTWRELTEQQLAFASDYLDSSVKHFQGMGDVKDVPAAVQKHNQFASDCGEKLVDHAKKTTEILINVRGELTDWAQEGFKAATAEVVPAATASRAKKA